MHKLARNRRPVTDNCPAEMLLLKGRAARRVPVAADGIAVLTLLVLICVIVVWMCYSLVSMVASGSSSGFVLPAPSVQSVDFTLQMVSLHGVDQSDSTRTYRTGKACIWQQDHLDMWTHFVAVHRRCLPTQHVRYTTGESGHFSVQNIPPFPTTPLHICPR